MATSQFTWIPFYKEFAEKLLQFKNNRSSLLDFIYTKLDASDTKYLHDSQGEHFTDIDPFTVFGMFNRGKNSRTEILKKFKPYLNIQAEVPTNFDSIPLLNNQRSHFFGFQDKRAANDIENLWELFEIVITTQDIKNFQIIAPIFNKVRDQFGIRINLSMALYWIRPFDYLSLDKLNRDFLGKYDMDLKYKLPEYEYYVKIIDSVKEKMEKGTIPAKSIPELSYTAWLEAENKDYTESLNEESMDMMKDIVNLLSFKKNIILHGAPGTGKTYAIPEIIVRICGHYQPNMSHEDILIEYEKLVKENRVAFTTFHQSYDYEDFIEGLMPISENGSVVYKPKDGIFKTLCERAQMPIIHDKKLGLNEKPTIWKVSLKQTYQNEVRTECLEKGHIRIGWDMYGAEITTDTSFDEGGSNVLNAFINEMRIGDIIFSCYTSKTIDAIGVVTGEYEWEESYPEYKRVRKVQWLYKGEPIEILPYNDNTQLTLSTVYKLNKVSLESVLTILRSKNVIKNKTSEINNQPYILVIDEINRGNISKIFGELITLLEVDKRISNDPNKYHIGARATLPYSHDLFGVPSNVYVIGTMNTTDRSVGEMDYAIRRRFSFVPLHANAEAIENYYSDNSAKEKLRDTAIQLYISVRDFVINHIVDDLDPEDLMLGHSYFMAESKQILDMKLNYEIIPLIKEYEKDGILALTKEERSDLGKKWSEILLS